MVIRRAMLVACVALIATAWPTVSGCASGRGHEPGTFSGDLALQRVKKTPAYQEAVSDIPDKVRFAIDATAGDRVMIAVYEADPTEDRLIATFRVLSDGRVYMWDWSRDDWRVVGTFR
jgi:hypothetical protein